MTSEVWQSVGLLSPCGTVSYPSNGLPGSTDVHKHAQTIGCLSRWFLSLAEGRKVKLACMRTIAGIPEGGLFLVCCHWSKGLPGFDSPRKYVHLKSLLPAHLWRRCRSRPQKLEIDHLGPNGLCVLERGCRSRGLVLLLLLLLLGEGSLDAGRPSVLSCAAASDAVAMNGGILLGSSLPRFFSIRSLTAHVHLPRWLI